MIEIGGAAEVVRHLEALETEERIRTLPHLLERAPPLEISDVVVVDDNDDAATSDATVTNTRRSATGRENDDNREEDVAYHPPGAHRTRDDDDGNVASLRRRNLRTFSLALFRPPPHDAARDLSHLRILDVGHNELSDLPGLSSLPNLTDLILTRNWFNTLPAEITSLRNLRRIDASRNFFRPVEPSLRFSILRHLPHLRVLDLSYNQKIGTPSHIARIETSLPQVTSVVATVWEKISSTPGAYEGSCAAVRNPALLRSQLEPWGTVPLRRRLVSDFGCGPTDPAKVSRAEVMEMLLERYRSEGLGVVARRDGDEEETEEDSSGVATGPSSSLGSLLGRRRVVRVSGVPVRKDLLDALLTELRSWRGDRARGGSPNYRERPSIRATCYAILRAPDANDRKLEGQVPPPRDGDRTATSRRGRRTAKKLERNRTLWDLAQMAMREADEVFAEECTEMAVTYGFVGSPHIDKQNCGPFYGLALGEFKEGTGQVCVECSARIVAEVDTKNRLGRIDGRYPHWVTPYDPQEERFSLIYYVTGGKFKPPGPAIFSVPVETT